MKLNFRIRRKDISHEDWFNEDCFPGGYIEVIDMKCLDCDYEEEVEADILLECFEMPDDDFPSCGCVNCNGDNLVPKDVYDQIKGNFIYK